MVASGCSRVRCQPGAQRAIALLQPDSAWLVLCAGALLQRLPRQEAQQASRRHEPLAPDNLQPLLASFLALSGSPERSAELQAAAADSEAIKNFVQRSLQMAAQQAPSSSDQDNVLSASLVEAASVRLKLRPDEAVVERALSGGLQGVSRKHA